MDRYDVSEVHGAYRLLEQVGPDTLVLVDAGLISGALIEQVRAQRAHVLGALEAGAWEQRKRRVDWPMAGVGMGGPGPFRLCPLSPAAWDVGAYHLVSGD